MLKKICSFNFYCRIILLISIFHISSIVGVASAVSSDMTSDNSFIALPLRIAGVGGILGIGYKADGLIVKENFLVVGTTFGNVLADAVIFGKSSQSELNYNLGYVSVRDYNIDVAYKRGSVDADTYRLNGSAGTSYLNLKDNFFNNSLELNLNLSSVKIKFESFHDQLGSEIKLPRLHFTDYEFNASSVGGRWYLVNFGDSRNDGYLSLGYKFQNTMPTTSANSETNAHDYAADILIKLHENIGLYGGYFNSRAEVINESRFNSKEKIIDTMNVDCGSLIDREEETSCLKLSDELSEFIFQQNTKGTSTPIGGNSRLRSFFESRFRAKYTEQSYLRLAYIYSLFDIKTESYVFSEQGYANDELSELKKHLVFSNGVGIRMAVTNQNSLRLDYAKGSFDSEEWHLVIGQSF